MKMKTTFLLLFVLFSRFIVAQNLVTNPNFIASKKPSLENQLFLASGWSSANNATPDLFCDSASAKEVSIPKNFMGEQCPLKTSNYAGIIVYADDDYQKYSEYIQNELKQPLVKGKKYKICFYVSLANNSARAVNGLGAAFYVDKQVRPNNRFIYEKPDIACYEVIKDTANWVQIKGSYIADGCEKYLVLGLFTKQKWKHVKTIPKNTNDTKKAYYYVSEVEVVEDK